MFRKLLIVISLTVIAKYTAVSDFVYIEPKAFDLVEMYVTNVKSKAYVNRNPGNLVSFRTGKFVQYRTFREGAKALKKQIARYQNGTSLWTDSSTTVAEYAEIYGGSGYKITRIFSAKRLLRDIDPDSLLEAHVLLEDRNVYELFKTCGVFRNR